MFRRCYLKIKVFSLGLENLAETSETIITQSLELHVKHKVILKW
jgi:hypothetical protein